MDHSVKLDRLPSDLEFPPELTNRIRYDSQRRLIVFHGPMSKATYDKLWKVHDDGEYRRAIEKLFCQATYALETAKGRSWIGPWLAVGAILLLAIAAIVIWYIS